MTLLICWLVFPAILGLLSLGCGLALERFSRIRLAGPLLLPAGFATMVVVGGFATLSAATAKLATPAVAAVALLGLGTGLLGRLRRIEASATAAAAGVFAVFGAPVLFSGRATFSGYIKLDDTATFLALTDRVMQHGRSFAGLAPSTYEATLSAYIQSYPIGSVLPLGIGHILVREDVAWLFQPYLAFLALLLALCLYQLAALVVERPWLRGLVATIGAQPALFYGYALWGGVKELAAAPMLALVAALTAPVFLRRPRPLAALPLSTAGAALVSISSFGALVWLLPVFGLVLALAWRRREPLFAAAALGFFTLLAVPALTVARTLFQPAGRTVLTSGQELGNLVAPLNPLQLFGIWPNGDFRYRPDQAGPTYLLIAVVCATAVAGLVWALQRRAWELPLFAALALLGAGAGLAFGSPWIAGKTLALASPAILFMALIGCSSFLSLGRRVEAVVATLAIVGGVAWSNVLAYNQVDLAPYSQLTELQRLDSRFAGQGPTLMTDYEPYGARHFLRNTDPEGASEFRVRRVPLRDGSLLAKGLSTDVGRFRLDGVLVYRTLILRRSPLATRPPAPYALVWRGRFYEVWQRPDRALPTFAHLQLADVTRRASTCGALRRFAATAGGRQLVFAEKPQAIVVPLGGAALPTGWREDATGILYPSGAGGVVKSVAVPAAGLHELWIGGSFRGRLTISLDGTKIVETRAQLNYGNEFTSLARVRLGAGRHRLLIDYGGSDLRPGSGGTTWPLGPVALTRAFAPTGLRALPGRDASALCGKTLDWVETLPQ